MQISRVLALAAIGIAVTAGASDAAKCNIRTSSPAVTTAAPAATTAAPAPASTAESAEGSTAADYDDEDGNDWGGWSSWNDNQASATDDASATYDDASTTTDASTAADASTSTDTTTTSSSTETTSSSSFAASSASSTADEATASSSSSATTTSSGSSATTTSSSSAATTTGSSTSTTTSSDSGSHGTFGTVTSGSDTCVVGDPSDDYISKSDVDWIYSSRMATEVTGTNCWIFDQVQLNKGSLDYCIRWDSNSTLALATASKFAAALKRQYTSWNYWLKGYDCWQYDEIDINIVGVAVRDASLLDWTDDSLGKIYVGDLDADGVPQCPDACYKHLGGAYDGDTSSCSGTPFDLSLWPTDSLEGGLGGYGSWWGQEVDAATLVASVDAEDLHILAHEIGHGFGLPDFYEDADFPNSDPANFPKCIMQAGASMTVTEGDGWMLRRAWEGISSRYNK